VTQPEMTTWILSLGRSSQRAGITWNTASLLLAFNVFCSPHYQPQHSNKHRTVCVCMCNCYKLFRSRSYSTLYRMSRTAQS